MRRVVLLGWWFFAYWFLWGQMVGHFVTERDCMATRAGIVGEGFFDVKGSQCWSDGIPWHKGGKR